MKNEQTFEEVAKEITYFLNTPDFIIAHNIKFDEKMIRFEYDRLLKKQLPYDFLPNNKICSMEASRYYCNLSWKFKSKKPKAPKLSELHKKLFWTFFEGAHDAMVDVEYTLKCVASLVKKNVIKFEEEEENVLSLF